ncbi:26S protease regulatory subunit 10B [Capsicum annuum]|uniref:26S protease regulatory subunit 10B n=1 Tax=Capsicum annuum TaxID=4072 RepID=A0A2G2ZMJ6_CAPAN|nr:26S protease regulatory subunit 10B [Capsicum annuum]PHT83209.1 26S protease regulatory subunit 10B [Capsicum annuum]
MRNQWKIDLIVYNMIHKDHCNISYSAVVSSAIIDKYISQSARLIWKKFNYARDHQPCIIFIDDIDAISGCHFREGTSADREIQRILMELLNQLDGFDQLRKIKLIMETNRPDVLDPTLLRPGRLDRKIEIPLLNEQSRMEILKIHVVGIDKHGDMRLLLSSLRFVNDANNKLLYCFYCINVLMTYFILRVLMGLICVIFCTICGLHPSVICLDAC